MKLDGNQLAYQKKIGADGICPIFHVVTKGGRHVVVAIRNGQMDPLAIGSHRAVALHGARKRAPAATWTELSKADAVPVDPAVAAAYEALTDAYRRSRGL